MPLLPACIVRIRFSFVPASLSLLFFPLVPRSQTDKLLSQKKLTVSDLKAVCEVLCLEKSGSKDELAARVVKFLADPSSDTCKKASSQKRKGADGTHEYCVCAASSCLLFSYRTSFVLFLTPGPVPWLQVFLLMPLLVVAVVYFAQPRIHCHICK